MLRITHVLCCESHISKPDAWKWPLEGLQKAAQWNKKGEKYKAFLSATSHSHQQGSRQEGEELKYPSILCARSTCTFWVVPPILRYMEGPACGYDAQVKQIYIYRPNPASLHANIGIPVEILITPLHEHKPKRNCTWLVLSRQAQASVSLPPWLDEPYHIPTAQQDTRGKECLRMLKHALHSPSYKCLGSIPAEEQGAQRQHAPGERRQDAQGPSHTTYVLDRWQRPFQASQAQRYSLDAPRCKQSSMMTDARACVCVIASL